jgi:glutaminyl-tRNA synthetase
MAFLEHFVREDLNKKALRVMGVIKPLKVVIDNYPDHAEEEITATNNPEDPAAGTRKIPFSKILYIEQDDFMEEPPDKFYRLSPGREVRLRYAYFIRCDDVLKDRYGNILEIHCSYDPLTRGGDAPDGRKVKATLHWVSAKHAVQAEIRIYENLFLKENPLKLKEGEDFKDGINPLSLQITEMQSLNLLWLL